MMLSNAQNSTLDDINRLDVEPGRCVDLIVLGINYRSTEDAVRNYFAQFGELVFTEIKRDSNGKSRGFGFIRFKNLDSQLMVLNKRHHIDGRTCDVKIPDSKNPAHEPECARKVFVARLPEIISADDLNNYFQNYGDVCDVYIPKPNRSFAFVTFTDSSIVPTLYGDHFINGCSVSVGPAAPKSKQNDKQFKRSHQTSPTQNFHLFPQMNMYETNNSYHDNRSQTDLLSNMFNPETVQAFLNQFSHQSTHPEYDWPLDQSPYNRHSNNYEPSEHWNQQNFYR
ncbi:unnamed protein product [Didymodactylos carnosus]|uniref:RRM domain-containing protein n=1 Tax=Didymodactylos carnosus TaxID=1234261 RepID=A0A814XA40_9BILA|nr:unnamed protein product [Didymodactylos carnosus]CAF3976956.1 unnamed protein product [Didymodactylos carnosus]